MPREVEPEFSECIRDLCQAFLTCNQDALLLQRFLRDLWTFTEARQFANRWQVACRLLEGKTQTETARELRLSSKTVHAVSEFVNGPYATGGYAEVAKRLRQGRH